MTAGMFRGHGSGPDQSGRDNAVRRLYGTGGGQQTGAAAGCPGMTWAAQTTRDGARTSGFSSDFCFDAAAACFLILARFLLARFTTGRIARFRGAAFFFCFFCTIAPKSGTGPEGPVPTAEGKTPYAQGEHRPQKGGECNRPKLIPQQSQDHHASNAIGQRHNFFYCRRFGH